MPDSKQRQLGELPPWEKRDGDDRVSLFPEQRDALIRWYRGRTAAATWHAFQMVATHEMRLQVYELERSLLDEFTAPLELEMRSAQAEQEEVARACVAFGEAVREFIHRGIQRRIFDRVRNQFHEAAVRLVARVDLKAGALVTTQSVHPPIPADVDLSDAIRPFIADGTIRGYRTDPTRDATTFEVERANGQIEQIVIHDPEQALRRASEFCAQIRIHHILAPQLKAAGVSSCGVVSYHGATWWRATAWRSGVESVFEAPTAHAALKKIEAWLPEVVAAESEHLCRTSSPEKKWGVKYFSHIDGIDFERWCAFDHTQREVGSHAEAVALIRELRQMHAGEVFAVRPYPEIP